MDTFDVSVLLSADEWASSTKGAALVERSLVVLPPRPWSKVGPRAFKISLAKVFLFALAGVDGFSERMPCTGVAITSADMSKDAIAETASNTFNLAVSSVEVRVE